MSTWRGREEGRRREEVEKGREKGVRGKGWQRGLGGSGGEGMERVLREERRSKGEREERRREVRRRDAIGEKFVRLNQRDSRSLSSKYAGQNGASVNAAKEARSRCPKVNQSLGFR